MRAFLAILAVALLLTGCATAPRTAALPRVPDWVPPANTQTYTALDVQDRCLEIAQFARVSTTDNAYVPVNHEWLIATAEWSRSFAHAIGWSYTLESTDCDKFALAFALAANVAAHRADVRAQPLIARMDVRQTRAFGGVAAGGYHSLNIVLTDRAPFLWVFEPQSRTLVPLSEYPNRDDIIGFRIGG